MFLYNTISIFLVINKGRWTCQWNWCPDECFYRWTCGLHMDTRSSYEVGHWSRQTCRCGWVRGSIQLDTESRWTCWISWAPSFWLDGCCNGWTCCLHIVNPVSFSWTQQEMDLLVWLDITCTVQLDTAADGLAGVAGHHLYHSVGHRSRWICWSGWTLPCSDGCCSR